MDDDYEALTRRPLKLSSDKNNSSKKKTKPTVQDAEITNTATKVITTTTTKAEEAFRAKQDKIAEERILKKASKSHKQRVEEFNKHLDSLSEHYDIPKVSWTK